MVAMYTASGCQEPKRKRPSTADDDDDDDGGEADEPVSPSRLFCLCDDLISKLSFRQVYYRTQQYRLDQHFTLDNLCSSAVVVVAIVVVVVVVINTDKSLSAITAEFNT